MLDRFFQFFSSLRLTVVCLALALALVFIGTIAQVEIGLYEAQNRYFRALFVLWTPKGTSLHIPVFPGGWLLGSVLLVNLIAAHIKRFSLSKKKIGIVLVHFGLILLLLGQFMTEVFQVESFMRVEEGEAKNFSEDGRYNELAIIDKSNPDRDEVVAIPESLIVRKGDIQDPKLPFLVRVKEFLPNSEPTIRARGHNGTEATLGLGERVQFVSKPVVSSLDDENKPAAVVEIVSNGATVGSWTVSTWMSKNPWVREFRKIAPRWGVKEDVGAPQSFTHSGKTYEIALRPIRYYKEHHLQLLDFTHERYKGTEIPKNFSSKVHLTNAKTGENREVLIYMNNPLRYAGETYYQGGFEPGDTVSILQVVRNPAWLTPYVACVLVGLGLVVQFMMHLIGFARRSAGGPPGPKGAPAGKRKARESKVETELPAAALRSADGRTP